MFRTLISPAFAVVLSLPSAVKAELKVEPDKENVVSSRLEGRWEVEEALSTRLGLKRGGVIEFKVDDKIVAKIPEKYEELFADRTIYLAGTLTLREVVFPFVLIEYRGNPHVVFFRERDGEPMGDAESFNVMLAVAEETENDLLFVGGDFNNQPFTAYERSKAPDSDGKP